MDPLYTLEANMTMSAQTGPRMPRLLKKDLGSEIKFLQNLEMLMTRVSKTLLKDSKCLVTWMQWLMIQTQMNSWAKAGEYSSTIKAYNKYDLIYEGFWGLIKLVSF